jgi:TRAP-type C4-dicarboxylate transport system permease large subunit
MDAQAVEQLLMALIAGGVALGVFTFVVVLIVLDRRALRRHFKAGFKLGLVLFVMFIPAIVLSMIMFDVEAVVRDTVEQSPQPVAEAAIRIAVVVGLVVGLGIHLLRLLWYPLLFSTAQAEWVRARRRAFPLLAGSQRHYGTLVLPALFGVLAALLSLIVFHLMGVQESEVLRNMEKMFPGLSETPFWLRTLAGSLSFAAAAFAEELLFRGVLLGFVMRVARGRTGWFWAGNSLVSLLWAVQHLGMTGTPLVKVAQIFVIGLVLGELARKRGVEAAMAGHAGLNVAAVLMGPLFM